jgi:cytochrome c553
MEMRKLVTALMLAVGVAVLAYAAGSEPPYWAFFWGPADPPFKDDGAVKHVPGSNKGFTITQIHDLYDVPDWFPEDHPSMPEPVLHGRKGEVPACGYCHLPNGLGRPENAELAGLPAAYIVQQMQDFKNGLRKSSEPRMGPPKYMLEVAMHATGADVTTAADYFAKLTAKPWIRVVETDMAPRTHFAGSMLMPDETGAKEPIRDRIIELPENVELTELRDSHSGFVAYVPKGSIRRGEVLVTTGGSTLIGGRMIPGKTTSCGVCHGPNLEGLANVPPLAGRSPSYLVRQLYDFQSGARHGVRAVLMRPVVQNLTVNDMLDIAAYVASRRPQ